METGHTSASGRLLARRERILEEWARRVRASLAVSRPHPDLVIYDTVPAFLRYLAEALHPRHPRSGATEGTTVAQEHGGERVRLTGYRIEDLIHEYQLLRDVLFEQLDGKEEEGLSELERSIILRSIDSAVRDACTSYALISESLREQFMYTLAHDLRGPLSAAHAGVSMILRRPQSPDIPRWASRAVDALERVDRRLRDLLDVGRLDAGERLPLNLVPCEVEELARDVIHNLEVAHGERFHLVVHGGPLQGHLDPDAVRRALENLLTNAVKYGASQRPITVSVDQLHGRVRLKVHNEGAHIPPEDQAALFQVFRRARSAEHATSGWGLGLALVRAVTEAHGGSIEVDSTPELGTTFTMNMPLDARPFQDRPAAPLK